MPIIRMGLALAVLVFTVQANAQQMPPGGGTPPSGPGPGGGTPPGTTTSPTLIGDSVAVTEYYPNLATPGPSSTVMVSSSVEIACPNSGLALCNSDAGLLPGEYIDIGATSISGRFLASFGRDAGDLFNGFVFTGLNFGTGYSGITSYTLVTNIAGLSEPDRIGFTSSSLLLNLLGLDPSVTTDGTGIGTYTINFNVQSVPEPDALVLLLGGLLVLEVTRRRRHGRPTI